MRLGLRRFTDRTFTSLSGLSVLLLTGALVVILGPLFWRGAGAVVFHGTVEFRRMQYDMHGRGNKETLDAESDQAAQVRQDAYALLDR
ncbi:MAG: hypothetical protein KAV00_03405, partial [Phycisphaerae bacterium]|nr:hypothetical protein [Phycisphaerae bacterium]